MQPITIPPAAAPFARASRRGDSFTCRHIATLALIVANPGTGVREIAAALDVPKPAVTRAAQALISDGLIISTDHQHDRRLVAFRPTKDGVEVLSHILGDLAQDAA